ncbi:MAG: peptidoglycan editing factor PgeF [Balneolaceae bacterium]
MITDSKIRLAEPVLNSLSGVHAWVSLKAANLQHPGGHIPGINVGFHTDAPEQEIHANRERLYKELGLNSCNVAWATQVHSTRVMQVNHGGRFEETDALVSDVPGVTLAIQVADCAAVLLADPISGIVGAAHAGWRGAVEGVVPSVLAKMVERGAKPEHISAWVSPCIGSSRFEVGPEVADRFPVSLKRPGAGDRWYVDLKGLVRRQLLNEGLFETNLDIHPGCTVRDANSWYSWRRERTLSGRMMALIGLNPTTDSSKQAADNR